MCPFCCVTKVPSGYHQVNRPSFLVNVRGYIVLSGGPVDPVGPVTVEDPPVGPVTVEAGPVHPVGPVTVDAAPVNPVGPVGPVTVRLVEISVG